MEHAPSTPVGEAREKANDLNLHHYFATNAMGWAIAETKDEAISRLLLKNTDPSWARNCLKDGTHLTVFVCRVPLAESAHYKIEWYVPQVEGITESQNYMVTYLTKTKYAVMRDPNDRIKQLEADVDRLTKVKAHADHLARRTA